MIFIAFGNSNSMAKTIYADSSNTNIIQTGMTWAAAFSDLQNAINSANPGDSIWVTQGTYKTDSANYYTFMMKPGVKLFGGFINTDTNFTQRNWQIHKCKLENGGGLSSIINNMNNNSDTVLIDGFKITEVSGMNYMGGGIINYNSNLILKNCSFSNNATTMKGGAIYNFKSFVKMDNCAFSGNNVYVGTTGGSDNRGGGAIYNDSADAQILNCNFTGNFTSFSGTNTSGGAIFNHASEIRISYCTFDSNWTSKVGGAIYNTDSSICTIDSCTFLENSAGRLGGAISNSGSSLTIHDCIFTGNSSSFGGGCIHNSSRLTIDSCNFSSNMTTEGPGAGIYNDNYSSFNINSCIFTGNSAYNNFEGGSAICNFHSSGIANIHSCTFSSNYTDPGYGTVCNDSASAKIVNSLFFKNSSNTYGRGGAICNENYGHSKIINCTISQNKARTDIDGGGGIYNMNHSSSAIMNSILWANSTGIANDNTSATSIRYSLVQGIPPSSINHNLDGSMNPRFVDTSASDYQLQQYSLCINAGNNDSIPQNTITDILGNERIFDGLVDMGVYEDTVASLPTNILGNDTSICQGNDITLIAPYIAFATYLWSTGDTNRSISVDTAGNYSVAITDSLGNTSGDTIHISIDLVPIVSLGNDTTLSSASSLLLNAGNPGCTYLWNTGENSQSITVTTNGLYYVTVTNNAGCNATDSINVTFSSLGINHLNNKNEYWQIYPNPTDANLFIYNKEKAGLKRTASILDLTGKTLLKKEISSTGDMISLLNIPPGVYILKIGNDVSFKIEKR